jgi:signal transduction histidine kinase
VNIDECYLEDLFDDLVAMNENYILHKNMQLDLDFDSELAWYLDRDLINILLNDILINAMRYGKKTIAVKAKRQDGFLTIQVEDDGPGYPESMLKINTENMQDFDLGAGRTGLGLFFARLIAEAHSEDGKVGTIHLENNGRLGGSVFTLSLP